MKKTLSIIAGLFALLAVSCTQEKIEESNAGQAVGVTFTAELPENIATKAFADGQTVQKLVYAVYNTGETDPVYTPEKPVDLVGGKASIRFELVSGKKYDFVFWAYSEGTKAYTVALKGQTLTVDYGKILSNDENNDAFYAFVSELEVSGATTQKVDLYRPFAQINLGTDDLDKTVDQTFDATKLRSSMKATVATVLDFATGEVRNEEEVTFAANAIPARTEDFPYDNENYDYLSMNYVLVGKTKDALNCEFAIYEGENEEATNTVTVANVPIQRNYRTNLYGSIITDPTDVNVEVQPGIGSGENIPVGEINKDTTPADFKTILEKGGNVAVTDPMASIDFAGLAIAKDLTLTLEAGVTDVKLGGNVTATAAAAAVVKAAATLPNITVVVSKGVEFPNFTFNNATENYTIKGDLNTDKPLTKKILTSGKVTNFTVENVKATGDARIESSAVNVTVKNCVATDVNGSFVFLSGVRNANILDNTISLVASYDDPNDKYDNAVGLYYCAGDILIDGNIITKTSKHGIFSNGGFDDIDLTISNNTISGVYEDGIKTDRAAKVTVTGNVIEAADYGIRLDRIETKKTAEYVITGNTISIDGLENDNKTATSAIRVRYRQDEYPGGAAVNLTAKGNKIGENGIPSGKYVNFTSEGMTVTGDYENAFDGAICAGGNYYNSIADVIAAGYTDIVLPAGEWTLSSQNQAKDLKITGVSKEIVKLTLATSSDLRWKTVTLADMTIIAPAKGDMPQGGVISVDGTTVHNNCIVENVYFCLGNKTEFNDCTFNMTDPNAYNVWTYGSNASFNNCEFYSAGKAALVYAHGTGEDKSFRKTNFKDCKFYASAPASKKAAIEIDSSLCPFDVNIENCTSEGFDLGSVSKNSLYNLKNGTLGVNCTITVDGLQYLADGITYDVAKKVYQITNGNGLSYAAANVFISHDDNKVVDIMNDIDMKDIKYTAPEWDTNTRGLTINGNGNTIFNLTVSGGKYAGLLGRVSGKIIINDLTIKDSSFSTMETTDAENTCGAFIALYGCYTENVESALNNCKVVNVTYGTSKYVGGLVGFGNMSGAHALLISNCEVDGADITSEYAEKDEYKGHCGGLVGGTYNATIQNSVIKNSKITVKGPRYGAVIGSILGGTTVFGEGIVVDNVTINEVKATSENVVGAYNNTNCDSSAVTVR